MCDLTRIGSRLILRTADDSLAALSALVRECRATRVVWNRRYEPAIIARDQKIKSALRAAGLETISCNSALLHEPWTVKNKMGAPFQVFTPYGTRWWMPTSRAIRWGGNGWPGAAPMPRRQPA